MPKIEKAQMRERMKKVGRNGKKKYQVLMEVQKVIKVPHAGGQPMTLDVAAMELETNRRFRSVNPKKKFKALLPSVLATQNAAEARDRKDIVFKPLLPSPMTMSTKRSKPMKNLRDRAAFSRRNMLDENRFSPSPRASPRRSPSPRESKDKVSKKSIQNAFAQSPSGPFRTSQVRPKILVGPPKQFNPTGRLSPSATASLQFNMQRSTSPLHFKPAKMKDIIMRDSRKKNPQQESIARQEQILNDIRQKSVPRGSLASLPLQLQQAQTKIDGRQFILNDSSASHLGHHQLSNRNMVVQPHQLQLQQPSALSSIMQAQTLETQSQMRQDTRANDIMPRILVSEDGECMNLTNKDRSEFSIAQKQKHGSKDSSQSRQQLSTAGTLSKKITSRGQPMYEQHSQYLVELMRPFANRAGTQGIGAKGSHRVMPQSKQAPRLSPLTNMRNQRPINTRRETKKSMEITPSMNELAQSNGLYEPAPTNDNDEDSSLDTKRSPFQHPSAMDDVDSGNGTAIKSSTMANLDLHYHAQSLNMFNAVTTTNAMSGRRKFSLFDAATSQKDLDGSPMDQTHRFMATMQDYDDESSYDTTSNLPYMTESSRYYHLKQRMLEPKTVNEKLKHLPRRVKEELQATQASQLFEFYEAYAQPSISPFVNLPSVASITPKIGDKVSMLANVGQTLTKRFQLAKAARIEARRRITIIEKLKALRSYIIQNITFKPKKVDEQNVKEWLLSRIAFREPVLIDQDVEQLLAAVYDTGMLTQHQTAALQIQTWVRMALRRQAYLRVRSKIVRIQRAYRGAQVRRDEEEEKSREKVQAVKLLQRQLRGYLAYQKYFAALKGTMTQKNLDYIINKYADAKEFMLECLQVKLAYLTRKLIKRRALEAEQRRLAAIAEKKRVAAEKEAARLQKIHEGRKLKKRQVRTMMAEAVEICYIKEDKRRDDAYLKEKKKQGNQPNKPNKGAVSKQDFPLEAFHFFYKQELFEDCFKKIRKRIAAKKKGKNKDLQSQKTKVMGKDLEKSKDGSLNISRNNTLTKGAGGEAQKTNESSAVATPVAVVAQLPVPDPHHFAFVLEQKRIRMAKFEKHWDPKKRKKDSVSFECTAECLMREQEKYYDPRATERSTSTLGKSTNRLQAKSKDLNKDFYPEQVNISIAAPMGTHEEEPPSPLGSIKVKTEDDRQAPLTQGGRRTVNLAVIARQSIDTTQDDVRINNEDLNSVGSIEGASNSSDDLSYNSETYDFLMVYMPMIRPKVVSSDDDDAVMTPMKRGAVAKNSVKKPKRIGQQEFRGSLQVKTMPLQEVTEDMRRNTVGCASPTQFALTGSLGVEPTDEKVEYLADDEIGEQQVLVAQPLIHEVDEEETDEGIPAESPVRVRNRNDSFSSQADTSRRQADKTELSEQTTHILVGDGSKHITGEIAGTQSGALDRQLNQSPAGISPSAVTLMVGMDQQMPAKLDAKSQQQLQSIRAVLEQDHSHKVLLAPVLMEERPLNEDSESVTASHARSNNLLQSGTNAPTANDGDVTQTSTKSYPKDIINNVIEEDKEEEEERDVTLVSYGKASTKTLMTEMGAVYQAQSTTIFQHKPIQIDSSVQKSVEDRYSQPPASSMDDENSKRLGNDSEEAVSQQNYDIKSVFDDEDGSDL